jgi:hypothetical protein
MTISTLDRTAHQAAFHLDLPTLEGVPVSALLRLRHDEKLHFDAFRTALRKALDERLALGASAESAAKQIQLDIIEPTLVKLNRRLQAAERALTRKAALRVGLGALTTTCGVLTSNPVLSAAGIGAALSAIGPLESHADVKKEVELDDMYFLLKATALGRSNRRAK